MPREAELSEEQRYWLERLRECEESGQTTKAYAESRGLSVSAVHTWRKRLVKRGLWPGKPRLFERVEISDGEGCVADWRIVLPNGVDVSRFQGRWTAQLTVVLLTALKVV